MYVSSRVWRVADDPRRPAFLLLYMKYILLKEEYWSYSRGRDKKSLTVETLFPSPMIKQKKNRNKQCNMFHVIQGKRGLHSADQL